MAFKENSTRSNLFLFPACEEGDLERIKSHLNSLSSSEICSIRDENKASLVHYASRYGHLNILKYFVEIKGIDISQLRTEHGATCAHDAAVCDQIQILNYIFNHNQTNSLEKLRWTVRDEQGSTPLHLACAYNSLNVVHYLLEKELADPHNRSYNGCQPIHYACEHGHSQCVKMLLNKSPDTVNEQTNQLLTPVHLACQYGSLETVQILVSNGANLKLKDQNGLNCLHTACQNSHLDIVQWLIEKQNGNINDCDYNNYTLMHFAAATGSEDIINYLLEKKVKIIPANNGNTPLHAAAENGQQSACAILIERGCCSLASLNSQQLTAADLAENSGYLSLSNELRLRANPPLSKNSSSSVQIENATIVRLVIKKRNVPRSDASNQVNEEDLIIPKPSTEILNNEPLNLSDRKITDKYAPWLQMGNQTTQGFQQEIRNIGSNLRQVRRDSLLGTENERELVRASNIPFPKKEEISTTTSDMGYFDNEDEMFSINNGFVPYSTVVAISKSQSNMTK